LERKNPGKINSPNKFKDIDWSDEKNGMVSIKKLKNVMKNKMIVII
jgi:hypothetical protein